jgi:hypothetical protein
MFFMRVTLLFYDSGLPGAAGVEQLRQRLQSAKNSHNKDTR